MGFRDGEQGWYVNVGNPACLPICPMKRGAWMGLEPVAGGGADAPRNNSILMSARRA